MSGKRRRLSRLFRHADGRAILVPIDHGLWYGPLPAIERPEEISARLIPESDGILVAPGFAQAVANLLPGDRALALRVGAGTALSPVQDYEAVFAGIDTALRLDADAVVHTLYLGGPRDDVAIRDLGQIIESSERFNMPVVAEFLPAHDQWKWEQVAHWARLGFEMGASVIKTIYTGDPATFHRVASGCPVPILVAGGPAVGSTRDLLEMVSGAIEAGGAGIAIGRRIWQAERSEILLRVLGKLIHDRISVGDALGILERPAA